MTHVMLDFESLGTTADAVIISMGAVKFDLNTGKIDEDGFYRSVSVESNLSLKRRISEDTLIWWMKQGAAAQAVFHEPKETLDNTLSEFADWLGTDSHTMWSNGADFDLPMAAHAYTQLGMEVPWKFWNSRCYRSWKNLPGAKAVPSPAPVGVKHNALSDAYQQAVHLCAINAALFGKGVVAKKAKA